MTIKTDALAALEQLMRDKNLKKSNVGRAIAGDPSFVDRLRNPEMDVTTKTVDKIWSFILKHRVNG